MGWNLSPDNTAGWSTDTRDLTSDSWIAWSDSYLNCSKEVFMPGISFCISIVLEVDRRDFTLSNFVLWFLHSLTRHCSHQPWNRVPPATNCYLLLTCKGGNDTSHKLLTCNAVMICHASTGLYTMRHASYWLVALPWFVTQVADLNWSYDLSINLSIFYVISMISHRIRHFNK